MTLPRLQAHFHRRDGSRSAALTLEVAATKEQQAHGLMYRTQLADDAGMLFVFAQPGRHGFWMRHTLLPLDIAWVSPAGVVTEIARLAAQDESLRYPAQPARYAVEVKAGTLARHGVRVGDRLMFSK